MWILEMYDDYIRIEYDDEEINGISYMIYRFFFFMKNVCMLLKNSL